ncbi:helix-turn-helix domain-containing protein [bacterium]|nr:helix-turn-helix domain-containing protein [bacterium]
MKCYSCGGNYLEHFGSVSLHDDIIGNYCIYNIQYYKCSKCGTLLFSEKTVLKIEEKESEIRDKLIRQLPISEFILASEAAKILDISRQALHKHRRIRRGLIYSISFGGKKVYHKRSVLLFKERGDGRFKLSNQLPIDDVKYLPRSQNQKILKSPKYIYTSTPLSNVGNLVTGFDDLSTTKFPGFIAPTKYEN